MPRHNPSASTAVEQSSSPSPTETDNICIIAYECVPVKSNEDINSVAKDVLSMALESAEYGAAGEKVTYGNLRGRELLEDKDDMKERMKRLEDGQANLKTEIANHKTETANHKTEISYLQDRVKDLTLASEGYRKIRHRFLEVYRRDIRLEFDTQGYRKIGEGNVVAHQGDAVADAGLYISGERIDEDVLIDLYGATPLRISYLSRARDFRSISTLNAGATWRANAKGSKTVPSDVAAAFGTFVEELKLNPDRSCIDGNNPLSKAYYAFWAAHKANNRGLPQRVA